VDRKKKLLSLSKMIKVSLTPAQESELKKYRSTAQSENAERALMVLMSHEGKSPSRIAKDLKRYAHTVRDWLKRYNAHGIRGLQRKFALGKSPALRESVAHFPHPKKFKISYLF
jgi:hypothetical protein